MNKFHYSLANKNLYILSRLKTNTTNIHTKTIKIDKEIKIGNSKMEFMKLF